MLGAREDREWSWDYLQWVTEPVHGQVAERLACLSDVVWNAAGILLGFHKDTLSTQASIFLQSRISITIGGVWTALMVNDHRCAKNWAMILAGGVEVWSPCGGTSSVFHWGSISVVISFNGRRDEHIDWYFGVNQNWHTPKQEEKRERINKSFLQVLYGVTKTTNCSCIWFKSSPS